MYKLGITGGIGSGKTSASLYYKNKGAIVFNADEEAKNYILNNVQIQNLIINTFGNIVTNKGKLNFLKLSEHIFSDKSKQNVLNQIMWPEVNKLISSTYNKVQHSTSNIFIVDAALIIESGNTDFFDSILLITAKESIRKKRIQLRKNIPLHQIKKRMDLQMPEHKKKEHCNNIIYNNGSLIELHKKLDKFWTNIMNNLK